MILRVKSQVKYQYKKAGVVKDVGPIGKEETIAPRKYKSRIARHLEVNKELIVRSVKELGQTQTVTIKIEIEEHLPLKLRPYRTPLH